MDKVLKALKALLPEQDVKEVADALNEMLEDSKKEIKKEFEAELEKAYTQHAEELASAEKIAEEGYQQAYGMIEHLRNLAENQKAEFETALEEGYNEAYDQIKAEEGKNQNIEVEIYEEYEKKLTEMRDYIVDKVDQFLQLKGKEIYEQAKKDILNDPRMVEHKVALDRMLEIAQDYISDEDYSASTSRKVEQALEEINNLKGQLKVLEAKNIRLGSQKTQLEEQVRKANTLLTEQTQKTEKTEKKERTENAKKVSGRGNQVMQETIIAEHEEKPAKPVEDESEEVLAEFHQYRVLSGLATDN